MQREDRLPDFHRHGDAKRASSGHINERSETGDQADRHSTRLSSVVFHRKCLQHGWRLLTWGPFVLGVFRGRRAHDIDRYCCGVVVAWEVDRCGGLRVFEKSTWWQRAVTNSTRKEKSRTRRKND